MVLLDGWWFRGSSDVTMSSTAVLEIGLDDGVPVLEVGDDPSSSPPSWCL